jgi:energy-coupling factor transporter ATP-binding protein EcfA2
MYLAAIYLEETYLFKNPTIINLGGKNFYELDGNTIRKKENTLFVPNFYASEALTMLTAIVGKNASGKTAMLSQIATIINDSYGEVFAMIFELKEEDTILITNHSKVDFDFSFQPFAPRIASFYYSPYLDLKNSKQGIDISLDSTIDKCLQSFANLQEDDILLFLRQNFWKKQFKFLSSEYGSIVAQSFGINEDGLNTVSFVNYRIALYSNGDIDFHNTPTSFRSYLNFIYKKIESEARTINETRPKDYSLVTLQKELLKNAFLKCLLKLIIRVMELRNTYLSEGYVKMDPDVFYATFERKTAQDTLYSFLDHHAFRVSSDDFTLIPIQETKNLVNFIFDSIDALEIKDENDTTFFDWNNKVFALERDKVVELNKIQNEFLAKLNDYHKSSSYRIREFIEIELSRNILSSGQKAALNLFSTFHSSFEDAFNSDDEIKPLNLILLDEADLGFHPTWRKKFIKEIIQFFNDYFNRRETYVQIIFTSHDPLTLSDVLGHNIVYLNKDHPSLVITEDKPQYSFGANISDLLSQSFFIDDSLIGDFAKQRIQEVIDYLNEKEIASWITEPVYAKRIIDSIGEPFLRDKLTDMFLNKHAEFIDNELKMAEARLEKLKNLKKNK